MGIKVECPNGHQLNLKSFLAGKRGICPQCGARFTIPATSQVETISADMDETAVPLQRPKRPAAAVHRTRSAGAAAAGPAANPPADVTGPVPAINWYVRHADGAKYGPTTREVIEQWLDEGRVAADSRVWRDGWPDWRVATEVFADHFATSTATVSPDAMSPGIMSTGSMTPSVFAHSPDGPPASDARAAQSEVPAAATLRSDAYLPGRTRRRRRTALIGLIIASVILLPVLVYVVVIRV